MGNLKRLSKIAKWVSAIVAVILFMAYVGVSVLIAWGINKEVQHAKARFAGDRIEALIAHVECENCRLEDRNHAVWALGQFRDKRALPVLYKYRTGKPCNHYSQICQYELNKAIRWAEGNSYMLPQLWRVMVRDDQILKTATAEYSAHPEQISD